ncbi:MAG: YbaB/EbfC family nucleoid-associated protein [Polyangia bacterium]|jgi:DNA-binding YbaB/EbfC family protein|nr:YbaB/EbfC family nucleoid-associated protein [Polyangia bacterium]
MSDPNDKMPGLGEIFGKVQEMQRRIQEAQERLGSVTVEAEAGAGMVRVVANGRREVVSIEVEPELLSPGERQMLQDLVRAAVNAALGKAERLAKEKMEESIGQLTGGVLPKLFGA